MRRQRINRTRQIILDVDGALSVADLLDLVGKRVDLTWDALTVKDLVVVRLILLAHWVGVDLCGAWMGSKAHIRASGHQHTGSGPLMT